jgi:hypothetical protein
MPAEAGIQRLKSLASSQKHAGMTVSERLFEFKSICSLTMSKAASDARMRHVRGYYSGQQFAFAGMTLKKVFLKIFIPAKAHYCPEYFVMPAVAGIQRLKSLDSSL